MKKLGVTLKEVAVKAGVSPASVSMALRGKSGGKRYLARNTVNRIRSAAKEMGYRPNALASSLRKQKSHMIGVLVPALRGNFYEEILASISQSVYPSFSPVLAVSNYDGKCERLHLENFMGKRIDGLVAVFSGDADNIEIYRELMEAYHIPIVLVDRGIPGLDLPLVRSDQYGQVYEAVKTLQEMGHQRIMYVYTGGVSKSENVELCKKGYISAMREGNLGNEIKIIDEPITKNWDKSELRQLAKELLDRWQDASPAPTALLVHNDWFAYEILAGCKARNINVPGDLSIMGQDDCSPSSLSGIELSSVTQDTTAIGRKAGELLLKLINGDVWDGRPVVLPTQVIMRKTTKTI